MRGWPPWSGFAPVWHMGPRRTTGLLLRIACVTLAHMAKSSPFKSSKSAQKPAVAKVSVAKPIKGSKKR
jgi:hypothetical protein